MIELDPKDLINHTVLSKYLAGGNTNIQKNYLPEKYKYKVQLLYFFIDIWIKAIELDKPKIKLKRNGSNSFNKVENSSIEGKGIKGSIKSRRAIRIR